MDLELLGIAILLLIAVAVIAIRLALSKIIEGIKEGQNKLTSELSEIRKLLEK